MEKLSSKVVYDKKSEKYVGVFAHKSLRCWDEHTTDLNKSKKLKVCMVVDVMDYLF